MPLFVLQICEVRLQQGLGRPRVREEGRERQGDQGGAEMFASQDLQYFDRDSPNIFFRRFQKAAKRNQIFLEHGLQLLIDQPGTKK